MAISYGDQSEPFAREWYQSNTKVVSITSPTSNSYYGSPISITYILDSDIVIASNSVEVDYSTDGGSSWSTATALAGDPSHDGTTGLAADADTETYTFMWDATTDLGATFSETDVQVRVRANDGANYSLYDTVLDFTVDMVPMVSLRSFDNNLGSTILVPYQITSYIVGGTFSIECEYSVDSGSSWLTATAEGGHVSHSGVSGLSESTSYNFVWDAEADLGASYNAAVMVRVRANNGAAWGGYATSSDMSVSLIPTVDVSSPGSATKQGSPILVVYTLNSNRDSPTLSITCDYSTDGGTAWTASTADTGHASHSGITGLSVGTAYTFVWDSATDLTTAFQDTDIQVRVRAYDGTNYSSYMATSNFEIDMLPNAPTLISPSSGYFDYGTTPQFVWTIPTDPGADVMAFRIEIDASDSFPSPIVDDNTVTDYAKFKHQIAATESTKTGNNMTYMVRDYTVSSDSAAVTFASLTDFHSELSVGTTLTNPQIMLVNKADRRCFIDPTTITATGFTIQRSAVGFDANGIVDIHIYTGAAGAFETYWVDLTVSTATAYTLGTAPFDTDLLGNTIPASITDLRPQILEGSDRGAFVSATSDTGFTISPSAVGVESSATIRVCLRSDITDTYQHQSLAVSSLVETFLDNSLALDDDSNGSAPWPDYLIGPVVSYTPLSDHTVIVGMVFGDSISFRKSSGGVATDATITLYGHSELDSKLPYYMDVSPNGVPDTYEGNKARYELASGDDPSDGIYQWRVTAGNIT
jgi:hypothetical protein